MDFIMKFILNMNTNLWLAFLICVFLLFSVIVAIVDILLNYKLDKIIEIVNKLNG